MALGDSFTSLYGGGDSDPRVGGHTHAEWQAMADAGNWYGGGGGAPASTVVGGGDSEPRIGGKTHAEWEQMANAGNWYGQPTPAPAAAPAPSGGDSEARVGGKTHAEWQAMANQGGWYAPAAAPSGGGGGGGGGPAGYVQDPSTGTWHYGGVPAPAAAPSGGSTQIAGVPDWSVPYRTGDVMHTPPLPGQKGWFHQEGTDYYYPDFGPSGPAGTFTSYPAQPMGRYQAAGIGPISPAFGTPAYNAFSGGGVAPYGGGSQSDPWTGDTFAGGGSNPPGSGPGFPTERFQPFAPPSYAPTFGERFPMQGSVGEPGTADPWMPGGGLGAPGFGIGQTSYTGQPGFGLGIGSVGQPGAGIGGYGGGGLPSYPGAEVMGPWSYNTPWGGSY